MGSEMCIRDSGLPAALLYWTLMVGLTVWNYILGHGYGEDRYIMEAVITCLLYTSPSPRDS